MSEEKKNECKCNTEGNVFPEEFKDFYNLVRKSGFLDDNKKCCSESCKCKKNK